jgi:putative MATE family efflux protein
MNTDSLDPTGSMAVPSRRPMSVLGLSWPLFLQLMFAHLLGLVDVYVLSRFSDEAAAAVGAVNTIVTFALMMFSFMGQGAGLVYAQCLGAQRPLESQRYHATALLLHLLLGLLASLLLLAFARDLAALLGLGGLHLEYGTIYLQIVGGTVFLPALSAMLAGVLSSRGHTVDTLLVSMVTNLVNVAALYGLVISRVGPQWGIRGVAGCTALATVIGLLLGCWLVFGRRRIRISLPRSWGRFRQDCRVLLGYILPTMLEPMLWQAAQIATTRIVTAVGPSALAARMYTLTITNLIGMFSAALCQGLQIVIGHLAGARQAQRAKDAHRATLILGLAISLGGGLTAALCSGGIVRGFSNDPQIVSAGQVLLWLALLYLPASSVIMTTSGALRAVGQGKYPALVGVVVLWFLFLPLAYLLSLPLGLGIVGVMLAMAVDENLRAFLVHARWRQVTAPGRQHALFDTTVLEAQPGAAAPYRLSAPATPTTTPANTG